MLLSICIPTYNRDKYLKNNIEIILSQINDIYKRNIEICISDNCSTDNTEQTISNLIDSYPEYAIKYKKNKKNLGADRNYINAMFMASGEYSILWGDDDFFKNNALNYIINTIEANRDISIFFSNRTCIDGAGNFIREEIFMREDVESMKVDFSNENQARSYFALSKDIACLFSFISSVVYKTDIIYERDFDESYIGTQYSFLYYWWNHLINGNKLLYSKISYINCTIGVHQSFGVGIKRVLVDYKGYIFIANKILKKHSLKIDFLNVVNKSHDYKELQSLIIYDKESFIKELLPCLYECQYDQKLIEALTESCSVKNQIKIILKIILPNLYLELIRKFSSKK